VRLKKFYTSREVAGVTGLTARQLQWWDARRLFTPAIASHRTEAGGFTERRYTAIDVLELQVLADLRRRGFSVPRLRRLLLTLRDVFEIRLYEAIGEGGALTLYISGNQIYARTEDG
jgi:DNA-binding transcriptional MerR regulator